MSALISIGDHRFLAKEIAHIGFVERSYDIYNYVTYEQIVVHFKQHNAKAVVFKGKDAFIDAVSQWRKALGGKQNG